jgi:hypothetical protein
VFCFGNCALGPSVQVDGVLHGRVDTARFDQLTRCEELAQVEELTQSDQLAGSGQTASRGLWPTMGAESGPAIAPVRSGSGVTFTSDPDQAVQA